VSFLVITWSTAPAVATSMATGRRTSSAARTISLPCPA
jgi:hypothetical protein